MNILDMLLDWRTNHPVRYTVVMLLFSFVATAILFGIIGGFLYMIGVRFS